MPRLAHLSPPQPFYRRNLAREHLCTVPAAWLQAQFWHGTMRWYDDAAATLLKFHFVVPPLVAFALWLKRRVLFFRFAASMIGLSFASAIVFLAFPSAPPWAAAQKGLIGHLVKLPPVNDVSSLSGPTRVVPVPANPYAAVPSLHAGYAFLVALAVAGADPLSESAPATMPGCVLLTHCAFSAMIVNTGITYMHRRCDQLRVRLRRRTRTEAGRFASS